MLLIKKKEKSDDTISRVSFLKMESHNAVFSIKSFSLIFMILDIRWLRQISSMSPMSKEVWVDSSIQVAGSDPQ